MSGNRAQAMDLGSAPEPAINPDRRYIFDITELVRFAHGGKQFGLSGIPRILLVLAHYAKHVRPNQIKIGYFDNVEWCYKEFEATGTLIEFEKLKEILSDANYLKPIKHWKHKHHSLKYFYHNAAHALTLSAKKLWLAIGVRQNLPSARLTLGQGDCLVCLGGSWNTPELLCYLEEGNFLDPGMADLAVLVPDMIPTLKGYVTGVVAVPQFECWLKELMRLDALLLVNSSNTLNDIRSWCRRHNCVDTKITKFGFGYPLERLSGNTVRNEVSSLKSRQYVLAVGPLTGRKNGGNLIRAWQSLSKRLPQEHLPLLVFAGNESGESLARCGLSEDLAAWDKLCFIRSPNDFELHHLYRNCLFTVYPSFYEGWGLPISESLSYGKVCATSNVSSMPEVGGSWCEYFDPADPDDITRVIEQLIVDPAYLEACESRIDPGQLPTWKEASELLLETLDSFAPNANSLPEKRSNLLQLQKIQQRQSNIYNAFSQ
jgi:glycosyltransferase involved in cell wall biosynthesis